jgi:hypothetical protein
LSSHPNDFALFMVILDFSYIHDDWLELKNKIKNGFGCRLKLIGKSSNKKGEGHNHIRHVNGFWGIH